MPLVNAKTLSTKYALSAHCKHGIDIFRKEHATTACCSTISNQTINVMFKRALLSSIFCFVSFCLIAAPVDLQRATAVANEFLTTNTDISAPHRAPAKPRLVGKADSQTNYFVFENEGGGFVIVAGDDRAYPILGYSTTASFKTDPMPSNVEAWLDQYAKEIQIAIDSNLVQSQEVKKAWANIAAASKATVIVSPLILTRWNQSPYYNDLCPMDAKM